MSEEKIRFQIRISPDTDQRIKAAMQVANCRSQNEFVEEAIRFYCSYISTGNDLEYLAPTLSSALTGIVHDSEKRVARLLFKQTVELSMLMRIIADGLEINESRLPGLRAECVRDVRGTNGALSLDEAVRTRRD